MRTLAIAAASAMAVVSVAAYAQNAPGHLMGTSPARPMTAAPTTRATVRRAPQPNPLNQPDVSKIIGTAVYGSGGKEIGDVSTVLMRPDKKMIDRLVIHSGGVLGIGGRYVAVSLEQFSWNAQKGVLTISKTAKDIDKMAEWKSPMSRSVATTGGGSSAPTSHVSAPVHGPQPTKHQ
jgi:sporulation protein YlmC with PRC-barrel domain